MNTKHKLIIKNQKKLLKKLMFQSFLRTNPLPLIKKPNPFSASNQAA